MGKCSYLEDTCSILLDIHVFTPKHPRSLFRFKPLGTKQIITPYFISRVLLSDLVLKSLSSTKYTWTLSTPKRRTDITHWSCQPFRYMYSLIKLHLAQMLLNVCLITPPPSYHFFDVKNSVPKLYHLCLPFLCTTPVCLCVDLCPYYSMYTNFLFLRSPSLLPR